jgi:hypothetical protein
LSEEDVKKAYEIISKEEGGLGRFANSMRSNAREFINNDDFKSAKFAIEAANKAEPFNLSGRINSAVINLELGDKKLAISAVEEFRSLALEKNNHVAGQWALGAMILAKSHDYEGYQDYCEDMYKAFPDPHNLVVKAFFVTELDNKKLFENAYYNAIKYPENKYAVFRDWGFFHAGLAEYRKGNFGKSVDYAMKSMAAKHEGANHELALKALNNSVLSLIYYKEGKRTQSMEALETAKYYQKEMIKLKFYLLDRYLAELLIAERDKLGSSKK